MTYTGPPVHSLSDLTHASRDGKNTLCGKGVHGNMNTGTNGPKMVWYWGWEGTGPEAKWSPKFLSVPSCRTCREAIEDSEYQLTVK